MPASCWQASIISAGNSGSIAATADRPDSDTALAYVSSGSVWCQIWWRVRGIITTAARALG